MNIKLSTTCIAFALIFRYANCQSINSKVTEDVLERSKRFVFLQTSGIGVSE